MPKTVLEVRGPIPVALVAPGSQTATLDKLVEVNFPKRDLDRLLLESADESLTDLLGAKVRQATYVSLEKNYGLARKDIPGRCGEFDSSLDKVFGVGGRTIGKAIAKRLFSKLGLRFFEKPGYRIQDYVKEAKATFSE
jgi:hypothetical protein